MSDDDEEDDSEPEERLDGRIIGDEASPQSGEGLSKPDDGEEALPY